MDNWTLALPFDTDDPEFVRGFEAGMLWPTLSEETASISAVVHAANAEMLLRLAEATGRTLRTVDVDETWIEAHFSERWV